MYGQTGEGYPQFVGWDLETDKRVPNSPNLEVIQDAGHSSNMDQPHAFNRVLLEFLQSLP